MFKQRWCKPDECWYNEQLASQFDAVLAIRSAFNAVISTDTPGNYDVTVACSSPLLHLLQVITKSLTLCTFIQ